MALLFRVWHRFWLRCLQFWPVLDERGGVLEGVEHFACDAMIELARAKSQYHLGESTCTEPKSRDCR
jgi:hypothetical protein